jgi:hypothetical protein
MDREIHFETKNLILGFVFLYCIIPIACKKTKTGVINNLHGVTSLNGYLEYTKDHHEYGKNLDYYPEEIIINDKKYYQLKNVDNEYISIEYISDTKPKFYFYVNNFEGIDIYSDLEEKNLIGKLSFGEKVLFHSLGKGTKNIYYVEYAENKFGYVSSYHLKQKTDIEYFKVAITSGLILRQKPDQNSKQLDLLPVNFIGEVKVKDNKVLKIANKKGVWLLVDYNNKTGWIFSGFVYMSLYKDSLTQNETLEENFNSLFEKLEELSPTVFIKKLPDKDSEEKEYPLTENYSIRRIILLGGDECKANFNTTKIINQSKNLQYEETFLREDNPTFLKNRLYINTFTTCYCCCWSSWNSFYFLLKSKIFKYTFFNSSYDFYWSVDEKCNLKFDKAKYSEKDSTLYLYSLFPSCSIKQNSSDPNSTLIEFKEYTKELFIVVKILEDEVKITRFFDKSIPKEYLKSYEESELIQFNR